jgi:hypothetical protein
MEWFLESVEYQTLNKRNVYSIPANVVIIGQYRWCGR